jgi:hypothetical protein
MTAQRAKLIPMGLTPDYVPDMGVWEAVRELIANCKDADPDYRTYTADADPNYIGFRTATTPRVAEVILMGCGASRKDTGKIGQFGEGFKIAALIATRTRGGSLTIELPQHTITFRFKPLFGERVLHAAVLTHTTHHNLVSSSDGEPTSFLAKLTMPGAANVVDGKIRDGSTSYCWANKPAATTEIFCKGIFIQKVTAVSSLFHYNLNSLKLNRDRSMAENWSLYYEVASFLLKAMDDDIADALLASPEAWENDCLERYGSTYEKKPKQILAAAFRRRYGDAAVLATGKGHADEAATLRGNKVVHMVSGLATLLKDLPSGGADPKLDGIQTSTDVLPKDEGYVSIPDAHKYAAEIGELRRLMDILQVPAQLDIFPDSGQKTLGLCVIRQGVPLVWLNERLFAPGQRFERIRTLIHELAHADDAGDDASMLFEMSLDKLAARLALNSLDRGAS